ncbi:MAG: acyltransferase [Fibrobacteres bacterium]|nr:acyltransferase [Fibrobacterota bacterium]
MNSKTRIDSLDILRGLMALSVATYHLSIKSQLCASGSIFDSIQAITGNYGVQGFFIISGFCFFHLYSKTDWNDSELKSFHIKRFFRIAPLYYLAVFANLALNLHVGPRTFSWQYFIENMTLTFGFFHPNHAMVLGGWSIGIEYVFYIALPILIILTRKPIGLLLLTVLSIALIIPWTFGAVENAAYAEKFHVYVQIPNHAFLFMLGAVLARLRAAKSFRFTTKSFLVILVLLAALAFPYTDKFYSHFQTMTGFYRVKFLVIYFLIIALFSFYEVPQNILKRVLVFFGEISYSVYLLHPFAFAAMVKIMPAQKGTILLFALAMIATIVLSAIVYRYLELPGIKLGRKLSTLTASQGESSVCRRKQA